MKSNVVLGIVPARGGSARLPGKNLKRLAGKELVRWAIDAAVDCESLDHVVVSSDSSEVLAIANEYAVGKYVDHCTPMRRPDEFCTPLSPAIDYVRHAIFEFERLSGKFVRTTVIVQASSPFTTATDISKTVGLLDNDRDAQSAVSIVEVPHDMNPIKMKRRLDDGRLVPHLEDEHGRMMYGTLPAVFVRNGSVYATRRRAIDLGLIVTDPCLGYVMPRERSIDINDAFDLKFAEFLSIQRGAHS